MSPRPFALVPSIAAAASVTFAAVDAEACATCGAGDPTLTTMGSGKPFAGRLRFGVEGSYLSLELGERETTTIEEGRLDILGAWSPTEAFTLALRQPLVYRHAESPSLASDSTLGPGDFELLGKLFVFGDRPVGPRHQLAVLQGLRLPTSPLQTGDDGEPLDSELQSGGGAVAPISGISYGWFPKPLSFFFVTLASAPLAHRFDHRPGAQLRSSVGLQWQPISWLAMRTDFDARWDDVEGTPDGPEPDTGGLVTFASPYVLLSAPSDLLISLGVGIPLFDVDVGDRQEHLIYRFGVVLDV